MIRQVIPREEWSHNPQGHADPLTPPYDRVILTMESRFPKCNTTEECVARMQEMEEYFINEGESDDLPYNFVVASDGNVYEGRGYYKKPLKSELYEQFCQSTLEIGVLGVTSKRIPSRKHTDETLELAKKFISLLIKAKMVKEDYDVHAFEGDKKLF